MRKNKIISLTLSLVIISGLYLYALTIKSPDVVIHPVEIVEPITEQDKTILSSLKYIGAKYTDNLELKYIDNLNDISEVDAFMPDTVLGMYTKRTGRDALYIKKGIDKTTEIRIISHEYLHYVWNNYIAQNEKEEIISLSRSLISNDWYLSGYMEYRVSQGDYSDREIFPVVCTERPDQYISTMVNICNKYIDRSKLTFLYN